MTNDELYELVPIGKENAVPLDYLVAASEIKGRNIRRIIEELIYDEKPVCNLGYGYFGHPTLTVV